MKFKDWKKKDENLNKTLNDYYAFLRSTDNLNFEKFNSKNFKSEAPEGETPDKNEKAVDYSKYLRYLMTFVVVIVLNLSNPSVSAHKDAIVEQIQLQSRQELGDWGILNGIRDWSFDKLGRGTISVTNRRTFIVFSVCDVTVLGVPMGYSVGFLGNAWIIERTSY
jgi:hypothetical protein